MTRTVVGLEVLAAKPELSRHWGRCGLLCNQASVAHDFTPAYELCDQIWGERLTCLFGPQHGFWGSAQDNMIETPHMSFGARRWPIYSLYSETREPTAAMLETIDTLVIDLQTVGCRIYTFKATILACLRAAKRCGKRVAVLDRPNPLGGVLLEGRCLDEGMTSFVGPVSMPMRHGLTPAEAALFFNKTVGAELEVVPMESWDPKLPFAATERRWVLTSPNLPTLDPVYVYPGMVLFEGTNVSEGRGTGLPFQLIGAPFIKDTGALKKRVESLVGRSDAVYLREACFEPTSGKGRGELCRGLQLHPLAPTEVQSYLLALAMICAFWELSEGGFAWKQPPYEYEYDTLPMKVIVGSQSCLERIEAFKAEDDYWRVGLADYAANVASCLIYPRAMSWD